MTTIEDHERKIIIEFCNLLENSKQLFNDFRELPQYGHKQWYSYFARSLDVYTTLWKFQKQHKDILYTKYGLKRWQVGEIASKIGQLYYLLYLRTSETTYLNESFSFYHVIRDRCYYTKAAHEDKCELMIKKLRYYKRFMLVCLLLKKMKLARELAKELDRQILDYGVNYDPDDEIEWNMVVDEVIAFIQAEPIVSVIHPDNYCVTLSYRLGPINTPPVERTQQIYLKLKEILIVGSNAIQVQFSELTMDMYRIIQTLERDPSSALQHIYDESFRNRYDSTTSSARNNKGLEIAEIPWRDIPHKFLLYNASPSQVLVYLASGCHDLPKGGALLLYISAEGLPGTSSKHPDEVDYGRGGVITASKCKYSKNSLAKPKEDNCLYPNDLYPFTRRPMFIIIDSDNSFEFQTLPRNFGQALIILMSPIETPTQYHDLPHKGNLFTLFLHSPLTAICYICDIHKIPLGLWERAQNYIENFMIEVSQLVHRYRIEPGWITFLGDEFLRLLVYRYIFCEVCLRLHRAFRNRSQLPKAVPPLPEELLDSPALIHQFLDLVNYLKIRNYFSEPDAGPSGTQHTSRSHQGE